ncbi:tyrosine-protein phosphatase [Agromyces mangrovi Wang et al. 2018]|uniref:tyrosine-protein phosphatase n=1 Tax=Agromyces mangrovi TaxID=1858653 RepID=UPI0025746C89|nr:tyrosine-protein phosphatase [Agromyces mangrovi]BDZ64636.1 hypothetical protein GCM10025877_15740 [Agromyces mangrovi]
MRVLRWDGYPNCRDLGGLPTSASLTGLTALRRVARGPRRERLTARGWDDARSWGIRAIVDLRSEQEAGPRDGDPDLPESITAGIESLQRPTEDQSDAEFRRRCLPILDSPEYWAHNWELQALLVRAALESIASAGPGVLVHCSAGRDRTGMISALLLGNAGVEPDAVVDDYVESVVVMSEDTSLRAHGSGPRRSRSELEDWLVGKTDIVRATAEDAPSLLAALGVDDDARSRLRRLLLP